MQWLLLLCQFIQQSLNSSFGQVQILLKMCWKFAIVRGSDNGSGWKEDLTLFICQLFHKISFYPFFIYFKIVLHSLVEIKDVMSDYLTNPHQNVKICNFSVPFSVYRGVPKKLVLEKSLLKSVLKDKKQDCFP